MQARFILFLCLLCPAGLFAQPNVLREKTADIYLSQLGVKEVTGNNDGPEVEAYLNYVGLPKGQPWCAAFVAWSYGKAGTENPKSGWSPAYFPANRLVYTRDGKHSGTPQMADVFGLYYNNLKRIAHVGFVHEWGNTWVTTVEGNTNDNGSREGTMVAMKKRPTKTIYAVANWISN